MCCASHHFMFVFLHILGKRELNCCTYCEMAERVKRAILCKVVGGVYNIDSHSKQGVDSQTNAETRHN